MAIKSTNINPKNESRYARHRSIWKGNKNKLDMTVAGVRGASGTRVYEYLGSPDKVSKELLDTWDIVLAVGRMAPKPGQAMGYWYVEFPPSNKLKQAMPVALHADLRLIWDDFITIAARRIGRSDGAGTGGRSKDPDYHGDSLVLMAIGPNSFDFIVSKYGYGWNNKRNHHFFHWQSRVTGFVGLVHVDDYGDN